MLWQYLIPGHRMSVVSLVIVDLTPEIHYP